MKNLEKYTVKIRIYGDEVYTRSLEFKGEMLDDVCCGHSVVAYLYECPGGYRVYVEDYGSEKGELYPHENNDGRHEYKGLYYSLEEVVEEWPRFEEALGLVPVEYVD